MHITQLKLLGFKSFVEPTELIIRPGLTGIVGPNGCGKSNLLEALRWVMGETSYKAMRGSGMDDVIFSGTQLRPSRNNAEVSINVDNSARTAPAEFNDEDVLEITRVIHRGEGSSYKVNGRDVRAKDIKLLFEDAATGARSHALVRQGQIGEIVNSKPQARRRILEDAAGIAGLYSRRHEAELRLTASENNLERLADVMGQMDAQLNSLKRQARHAVKYREISQKLRNFEALSLHLKWCDAKAAVQLAETDLAKVVKEVQDGTVKETAALNLREELNDALKPLREEEAARAAALHRLTVARDGLDESEKQARLREADLQSSLSDAKGDLKRDEQLIEEGAEITKRLGGEIEALENKLLQIQELKTAAKTKLTDCATDLNAGEARLTVASELRAEVTARKQSLTQEIERQSHRISQFELQILKLEEEQTVFQEKAQMLGGADYARQIIEIERKIGERETQISLEDASITPLLSERSVLNSQLNDHALSLRSLETEIALLEKLLRPKNTDNETAVLDELETTPGYEQALWAALGDDLDVPRKNQPEGDSLTSFWREINLRSKAAESSGASDAAHLPADCPPLSDFIKGPPLLSRRLAYIGVVEEADAFRLQQELKPGQCLVSKSGGLWRWDGFVVLPDAPSSAPQRLTERNRLPQLITDFENLENQITDYKAKLSTLTNAISEKEDLLKQLRIDANSDQALLKQLNQKLREEEQASRDVHGKLAALSEGLINAGSSVEEALQFIKSQQSELDGLADISKIEADYAQEKETVQALRSAHSEAQLAWAGLEREDQLNQTRLKEMITERDGWLSRTEGANIHISELQQRIEKLTADLAPFADLPDQFKQQRQQIFDEISAAETERNKAGDALAAGETRLNQHEQVLRKMQAELMKWREEKARVETRLEGNAAALKELMHLINSELRVEPDACLALSGFEAAIQLPPLKDVEADVARLKLEREKLGPVNLRAEDEIREMEEQFGGMVSERDDLESAVQKLRTAVNKLNEEGRQRLLKAFDEVNAHFKKLFQTLFAGGEAELQLIASDDPLESGLEILARPPGKKPQVLTLLSGGEKALTAMSLIFAVFLTNPSPICVLDEVDAPLDDSNVDRFCLMMEEMAKMTDTRFLVITHHPMTMERMDRLFGVTMSEKGVSQLVSVDLAEAEGLLETA